MADMTDIGSQLIADEDLYIVSDESVAEAEGLQPTFSSSVTVRVANFLRSPLTAVRTCTKAGEIEVPQRDVRSLERGAVLCKRTVQPPRSAEAQLVLFYYFSDLSLFQFLIIFRSLIF